jgi:hypothetical protein
MLQRINQSVDQLSEYLAQRKGLIPLMGVLLVLLNFVLGLIPGLGWVTSSDLFLHLGVITAIVGFMLAWAL